MANSKSYKIILSLLSGAFAVLLVANLRKNYRGLVVQNREKVIKDDITISTSTESYSVDIAKERKLRSQLLKSCGQDR